MLKIIIKMIDRIIDRIKRECILLYYRQRLRHIGKEVNISSKVKIYDPENVSIGDNVTINDRVIIQSCNGGTIDIGNNVTISYDAMIITGRFMLDGQGNLIKDHFSGNIIIEDNVWICAGAIILSGVTIKKGSIIGAGAIVSSDIPEYSYVYSPRTKIIKIK